MFLRISAGALGAFALGNPRTSEAGYCAVYDAGPQGLLRFDPTRQAVGVRADASGGPLGAAPDTDVAASALVKGRTEASPPLSATTGDTAGRRDFAAAANIYLHWFDKAFHPRRRAGPMGQCQAGAVCGRLCGAGAVSKPATAGFIEDKLEGWLGLTVNREKTRVVELQRTQGEPGLSGLHLPVRPRPPRRQSPVSEPGTFGQGAGSRAGGVRQMTGPEQCHTPCPN